MVHYRGRFLIFVDGGHAMEWLPGGFGKTRKKRHPSGLLRGGNPLAGVATAVVRRQMPSASGVLPASRRASGADSFRSGIIRVQHLATTGVFLTAWPGGHFPAIGRIWSWPSHRLVIPAFSGVRGTVPRLIRGLRVARLRSELIGVLGGVIRASWFFFFSSGETGWAAPFFERPGFPT